MQDEPVQASGPLPKAGDVVAGRYEIGPIVGRGGMGVVFAATHGLLNERVAIKVLVDADGPSAESVARFMREARAAARIQSEHVARVFDVGQLETGLPYMVLELLEGADLRSLVEQRGPLPVGEAADYLLQALEGLAQAHALGIIHRDLKPSNLFLARRKDGSEIVKVLDFGVAKYLHPALVDREIRTTSKTLLGSPQYMSPEQLRRPQGVDARSDIWSLGVLLYHLLTAQQAFVGESLPDLILNIVAGSMTPMGAHRPDLPERVERIVARCVACDPGARFPDVLALAEAIAPLAPAEARLLVPRIRRAIRGGAMDISNLPAVDPVALDATLVTTPEPWTTGVAVRPTRWRRVPWVGVALAVAAASGAAAVLRARHSFEAFAAPGCREAHGDACPAWRLLDGGCAALPPSCASAGPGVSDCGLCAESCCASVTLPGGTYDRTYGRGVAGTDPATVSSFRLDQYEVTVGRFRHFAQAWRGGWRPASGSGKHSHLNGGRGLLNLARAVGTDGPVYEAGWLASHDGLVQFPSPGTTATWTVDAGANENLPINWINWYTAYAFCIWDDGFLSSEAEWEYAAAAGDESRAYPWGSADPGLGVSYAAYNCFFPNPGASGPGTCVGTTNLAPVGMAALGAGKWGQLDLAGNVYEWDLDWCSVVSDVCASSYVSPCVDCADLDVPDGDAKRVQRGGGYDDPAMPQLLSEWRHANSPGEAYSNYGIRCARSP